MFFADANFAYTIDFALSPLRLAGAALYLPPSRRGAVRVAIRSLKSFARLPTDAFLLVLAQNRFP